MGMFVKEKKARRSQKGCSTEQYKLQNACLYMYLTSWKQMAKCFLRASFLLFALSCTEFE